MRHLVLLALVTLAAFPLSARGRWHGPRREVVEVDACRDGYRRWDDGRWDGRGRVYYRSYNRDYDCDDDRVILRDRVVLRPLAPPFQGRVELWIR